MSDGLKIRELWMQHFKRAKRNFTWSKEDNPIIFEHSRKSTIIVF